MTFNDDVKDNQVDSANFFTDAIDWWLSCKKRFDTGFFGGEGDFFYTGELGGGRMTLFQVQMGGGIAFFWGIVDIFHDFFIEICKDFI